MANNKKKYICADLIQYAKREIQAVFNIMVMSGWDPDLALIVIEGIFGADRMYEIAEEAPRKKKLKA